MPPEDKFEITELVSRYFLAMDALTVAQAIDELFCEDAVWEYFNLGAGEPGLRIASFQQAKALLEAQATMTASLDKLRHHMTGFVFDGASDTTASGRIKVLVTSQRADNEAPVVRNTAVVHATWRKQDGRWKISGWHVHRDSSV